MVKSPFWTFYVYQIGYCFAVAIAVNVMIYGGLVGALSVGALSSYLLWNDYRKDSARVQAVKVRLPAGSSEANRAG